MKNILSNDVTSFYSVLKEKLISFVLFSFAFLSIVIISITIFILFKDSIHFFKIVSFSDYFLHTVWEPFGSPKKFGVLPLILGSLMVAIGSCLVAVPLGLGVAIYVTQYASDKARSWIVPVIEALGGIPTIVYGYFALVSLTPFLQLFFPTLATFNALSASIVVGIAITPMISSMSADALSQVPKSIQLAGYAVGMKKFFVIIFIIIPAAFSGIFSAILLAFARAIGETMAVTLAAGATPNMNFNYFEGIQTITAFIAQISLGDVPVGSTEYYTIYSLSLTLFVITFIFNQIATLVMNHFHEKYE